MNNLKNALLLKQLYQLKNLGYRYTSVTPFDKEKVTSLELPHTLQALRQQVQQCHLCELSKSRQKVVFGEGNPNATLMFIGEEPGVSEDTQGKPFLGRSGEMLTRMIENVLHLKREEVYITNIVKCRPPQNRTPKVSEIHSCLPYVQKEIECIQPKLIVTLGEVAYHYLTGDTSQLTTIRGIVRQEKSYKVIPTYHPSYLLRNPSIKKEVFEDLKKVKSLLDVA
jgi:uracil-DNA glycosylase family 4